MTYLVRKGEAELSVTMVRHALRKRKGFPKNETVDQALFELNAAGYIQLYTPEKTETGGRPAGDMLRFHPKLLKESAESKEKQ